MQTDADRRKLVSNINQANKNKVESFLWSFFSCSEYCGNAYLKASYESPMGVLLVIDDDTRSAVSLSASMREVAMQYDGMRVHVFDSVPGIRGVGALVCADGHRKIPLADIMNGETWRLLSSDRNAIPLPLGIDFFGHDLVLDLAELSVLTCVATDTLAQCEIVEPLLTELLKFRDPSMLVFHMLNGDCPPLGSVASLVPDKFISGKRAPHVRDGQDKMEIEKWCKVAFGEVELFMQELEFRRRLFQMLGVHDFKSCSAKSAVPLPHILLFVSDVPGLRGGCEAGGPNPYALKFVDLLSSLMTMPLCEYGMHMLLVDFELEEQSLLSAVRASMEINSDIYPPSSGMVVGYGGFGHGDSLRLLGSRVLYGDACGAVGFYKAANGEIYRYAAACH